MKLRNSTAGSIGTTTSRTALVAMLVLALAGTGLETGISQARAATMSSGVSAQATRATATTRANARRGVGAAKPKVKKKKKHVTSRRLPKGWRGAKVSWYGPGLYGGGLAGGGKLYRNSMLVAHKSLPFGTKVEFWYKGRSITVPVKDRGPYVAGREFDLGPGPAHYLRFSGVGVVQYRIVPKVKKPKKVAKPKRVEPLKPQEGDIL